MRIRAATNDDFPAPVRLAISIFAPPLMLRLIFFSTCGPPRIVRVASVPGEVVPLCIQAQSQAWCTS